MHISWYISYAHHTTWYISHVLPYIIIYTIGITIYNDIMHCQTSHYTILFLSQTLSAWSFYFKIFLIHFISSFKKCSLYIFNTIARRSVYMLSTVSMCVALQCVMNLEKKKNNTLLCKNCTFSKKKCFRVRADVHYFEYRPPLFWVQSYIMT